MGRGDAGRPRNCLISKAAARSRRHRDRRRIYRSVDGAAFARSRRRRRHRRSDGAGLGRVGPQQRPGHPDAVAARPGRHYCQTWCGRRAVRRVVARQRLDAVRSRRGAIKSRPSRNRPAGCSRCIRPAASGSPSVGCGSGRNSARRSSCCPATRPRQMLGSDAWFGGFWNRSGGHINPLALSRGLARVLLERGGRIYARSPATVFERRNDRWVVRTARGEISGRALIVATNAYTGEFSKSLAPGIAREVMPVLSWQMATQPLAEAARKTIIPGRQAMSDTHGELYFARYDARDRLVTGGAVIGPVNKAGRMKSIVAERLQTTVAADRRRQFRSRLERLRRNDDGFPAAHPSSRAQCLWLDRLQRPRGRALDRARGRILQSGARPSRKRSRAAVHRPGADRRARAVAPARAADADGLSAARCERDR